MFPRIAARIGLYLHPRFVRMAGVQSLRALSRASLGVAPERIYALVGFPEISQLVGARYRASPPCLVDLYMEPLGCSPGSPTFLSVLGVQTVELPIHPNRTLHGLNPAHVTF
jgi:hypothetical protein